MTSPDGFFARLRKGDREAALFAFAVVASVAILGFIAVIDPVKRGSNASDHRIFGNKPARAEYHYARPDFVKASVSAEWVVLTFACPGDRVSFYGFENDGNLTVLETTGTEHLRELVRSRGADGTDLCHFRYTRESTRLGDYLARAFGHRCLGTPCELQIRWDEVARSCTHPLLLDDVNWDGGVSRGRPDLVLFPAVAVTHAGFLSGDEVILGARTLRIKAIERTGAYAHLTFADTTSAQEVREAGWACRKVPA